MLVLENVTKRFGDHLVLSECNLTLPKGESWGLVGPNGVGKTTTLRLIAGLEAPTAGRILVDGHAIDQEPEKVHRLIGFCPDVPFAYPFLTGWEFLSFIGSLWRLPPEQAKADAEDLLERLGLAQAAHQLVETYSRGMLQKLGLITAVLHRPKLLLLDEPFTAVDAESRVAMLAWLRAFVKEGGTLFFATHDMELIRTLANKWVRIVDGHMVQRTAEAETAGRCTRHYRGSSSGDL
ncbi:MAG: ABC transporter ATP-binding protein [Firmicutes bacterium]|nr:ABC transporter ATP-binding protein [Bacillota bacterium]